MMKKNTFIFLFLLAFISNFTEAEAQNFNSYILRYTGSEQKLKSEMNKIGIEIEKSVKFAGKYLNKDNNTLLSAAQTSVINKLNSYYNIKSDDSKKISRVYEVLKNDAAFISLEPNFIYQIEQDKIKPDDLLYNQLWWLQAVNTEAAWEKASGNGVIIGMVDTGIDYTHPDLMGNLWINSKEDLNQNGKFDAWQSTETRKGITGDLNGIDDDGNGYADDIIGYDFVDQPVVNYGDYTNPDPIPEDQGEHGTLVAGVMSAVRNNKTGIAGIAYNSKILTAKAFDITGNAESDDIARAIIYCVLNGAKVLNFSFGDRNESPIVQDAVKFANESGCVMIASSGNNGWNFEHYPSGYPEVISAGGIDETGAQYGRANYGSLLDLVAPAVNILTTDVNGSYKAVNGTSLSSPIISAAAALLLEINPALSPEEIKGILQMSARREFKSVWDVYYGAGILDVGKAVNNTVPSAFEIYSPQLEENINKEDMPVITVTGTAASSLFDSYDLAIGSGIMPESWISSTAKIKTQVKNGELGKLDISELTDGVYTISLRVYQKNLNIIEKRIYITVTSSQSKIKLNYFNIANAYFNAQRVVTIGAATDKKCSFILKYFPTGSENKMVTRQIDFNTPYHTIVLGDEVTAGIEYSAEAVFYNSIGDSLTKEFTFIRLNDVFQTTNFIQKSYTLPRTYLLNEVADLYNNGKKHLAVNDLSSLSIDETLIYEFNNNQFSQKDTSAEGWIPAGFGDSNGDGIPEIFGTADGKSTLKQGKTYGDNPFAKEIYRSPIDSTFWAEKIFDIDRDGTDELIGYKYDTNNGNYYAVYKFTGGKYQQITRTVLPESLKNVSVSRGAAIADFDGDGNYELVFANNRGNLFIYEYKNNILSPEYIDSVNVASSVQFIEKPDIDGDGKPEIMQLYAGTQKLANANETGTPLWTVRLIRSTSANTYSKEFWSENIYGVRLGATRQGVFYRNGSAVGDVNKDGTDEIVISAFPNLYIWSFDKALQTMKPLWYFPTALSNSAVIYDFDGNGVNEIGLSTFSNTSFFEFDANFKGPKVPTNFDGWAESQTEAYFKWDAMPDAKEYVLFSVDRTGAQPKAVEQARTVNKEIHLTNLTPNKFYEFVVASSNPDLPDNLSDFSDIVEIYTYPLTVFKSFDGITANSMTLNFAGKLFGNYIAPENFVIYDSQGTVYSYVKSAIVATDSSIILSFDKNLDSGKYFLKFYTFRDFFGNPVKEENISFEYIPTIEEDELYLLSLEFISETLVRIKFSDILHFSDTLNVTATNPANYKMAPIGRVLYAEVDPTNPQYVLLNLSQEIRNNGARGRNYTITASNIISDNGKLMTKGAGNTLGFVISNDNLREVYVYPNPIRKSENPDIFFANLTSKATVTIMTTDGAEILTLTETDGNGGVEWNGRDKNGDYLPVGIYLYTVTGTNSEGLNVFEEKGKFAIVP